MSESAPFVPPLLDALGACSDCESASRTLLNTLWQALEHNVGRSHGLQVGQVHMRPGGAYEALETLVVAGSGRSPLPSASTWRWVEEHRRPVFVDLIDELLWVGGTSAGLTGHGTFRREAPTLYERRSREITHILAFPLIGPLGLGGFVSLEVHWQLSEEATVERWHSLRTKLQLLVQVASPWLLSLRTAAHATLVKDDPLIPVAGTVMQKVLLVLSKLSKNSGTLLLRGPTGVGKTRIAQWCHERSGRTGEFVRVQLSAHPGELGARALFGSKPGAFTGAVLTDGSVHRAQGGSLFVDEVDKLSHQGQLLLLDLLDRSTYRPLGGDKDQPANVRFIIGTNANLEEEVRRQRFLQDLYYRISVFPCQIPPLRERREDIVGWGREFLKEFAPDALISFTTGARALLTQQPWPGNLRELHTTMQRIYALAPPVESHWTIDEEVVRSALRLDVASPTQSLLGAMRIAASAFVDEVEHRADRNESALSLDHASAFTGLILQETLSRHPNKRQAFTLLGKKKSLQGDNHYKILDRETKRVRALQSLLEDS